MTAVPSFEGVHVGAGRKRCEVGCCRFRGHLVKVEAETSLAGLGGSDGWRRSINHRLRVRQVRFRASHFFARGSRPVVKGRFGSGRTGNPDLARHPVSGLHQPGATLPSSLLVAFSQRDASLAKNEASPRPGSSDEGR